MTSILTRPVLYFSAIAAFSVLAILIADAYSPEAFAQKNELTNQPPNASPDSYPVHRSLSVPAPGVLANDSDPDGDQISVAQPNQQTTSLGNVLIGSQGSLFFTATTPGSGSVTVGYQVCDNQAPAACSSSTVTFNVANQYPIAPTIYYEVTGPSLNVPPEEGIFTRVSDPDGDPLTVGAVNVEIPGEGHVTVNNNGGVGFTNYRSTPGYVIGNYNVCDDSLACTWGIIFFVVEPTDGENNAGYFCPSLGEPVNVTNGNMWLQQIDFALPGIGEVVQVNRFYNSMIQRSGMFGFGWTTQYDESLWAYGDRILRLNMPDSQSVYFARAATSDPFVNVKVGVEGQIIKNQDNSFTLTFKDGRKHQFNPSGRLLWQKDRNGNQTTLTYDGNGNISNVTDAFGRTLTLIPNANGTISKICDGTGQDPCNGAGTIATYDYESGTAKLSTVTYGDASKYKFEYDTTSAPGKVLLKTVKDALDNIVETHNYDSQGRATTSEKHGGIEKYEFTYSSATLTSVKHKKIATDPYIETKYYFDKSRGRNVVTKTEGVCSCGGSGPEIMEYFYDGRLNRIKTIDALGNETTATYDLNGNRLSQTDRFGTQQFTYNSVGQVLTYRDRIDSQNQDPNVKTAVLTYDSAGNPISSTDALGKITTLAYPTTNNKGLPDSVTDARNNITKFKWFTTSGLLEEIEDPYTKKTKFTYDARGRVKTVTNALNHVTTYNYFDDSTRTVEMIYPNSDKITYKYDIRRTLESVTDERGKITGYEFDPQYRLKKITDPLGHVREFGYDLMSNRTSYKDPLGNITDYTFDDFGRVKEIEYPAATSGATRLKETFKYDKLGRTLEYRDTASRLTSYAYNDTTRTNTVTNAELEVTATKYNQRFQTVEVKDAINQEYTFAYDPLGRQLSQTRAGATTSFQYDEVGNRKERIDYMGRKTKYTHDNLNRLTEIEYLPTTTIVGGQPSPALMPNQKSTYVYDYISRLISATNETGTVSFGYDNRNRTTSTTDVFGHTINYEYERTVSVNQRRLKFDGAMYAVYNFDDAERLASIVNSSDSTTISFGYDNEDKVISRSYPNGVTTSYQYFDNDLLKRITDSNSSGTLFDRQYLYNSARQISQIIEPTRSRTFGYDNVDRLTSVTDAVYGNETYSFDDVGNRLTSHLASNYDYQAGQFNRLISATTPTQTVTYSHDANGNTTTKAEGSNFWRYTWDYENRLGEASTRRQKVRYKFDALGRRVQRYLVGGKENTKFVNDGKDVLVDDNLGTLTKYINGGGIDNKLRQTTGTTASYFLTDHLGSTNGLADASGAITSQTAYDSFGKATNASFPSRYQFTGREYDSFSGFHYYRARSYDANLGRFASEDPIGFGGGDVNLYGYVWNNQQTFTDPSGLFPFSNWGGLERPAKWADDADKWTENNRQRWQGKQENWRWNGSVNTVADLASGFNNMFRVGTGLGQALYCDVPAYRRLELVSEDVVRAGSLFLTMAAPFAGRLAGQPASTVRPKGPPKPSARFETPTNPPQPPLSDFPAGWRVRTGAPTEQYPNGYWRLEKPMGNGGWQGIDPSTMKPGTHPETHIPLPPR